jgi:hypothetical protein
VEIHAPEPLRAGIFYSVESTHYFRIEGNKTVHVYPREEFFEKFVP